MKAKLLVLFVALLMVGCGESSQPSESTEMNSTAPESPNPSGGVDTTDTAPQKDAIETAVDWSKLEDRDGVTYLPNTDKPFSGYAKRAYEKEQVEVLAQLKDGYVVRLKQWQENGTPRWDIGFMEGKVGVGGLPWKVEPPLEEGEVSHGLATLWHENGQKRIEANYKDGKRDGLYTSWHENGQKKGEGTYKEGKLDGPVNTWHENGQKKAEITFKDGKKDGLATQWYENGQKREEGNLKNSKPDGPVNTWYENGQKMKEENYKDGKLMSAVQWKPNGQKCPVTDIKDGNGVWVWYTEDGTENTRTTYKDGERVRN